jgi:hypothetical protein
VSADSSKRWNSTSSRSSSLTRRWRLYDELTSTIDGELGGTVVKPYEPQLVLGRPRDLEGA